jgi:hypothetical protein
MRLAIPALGVTALLTVCSIATVATAGASSSRATHAGSLGGKWSGRYGGSVSGTFTLHWKQTGSRLSGTIKLSNPNGTYGVGGSVHHGAIKFGAVSVGATYTGKVSGKSMSGTWKSGAGGGTWSAHKTS